MHLSKQVRMSDRGMSSSERRKGAVACIRQQMAQDFRTVCHAPYKMECKNYKYEVQTWATKTANVDSNVVEGLRK